MQNHLQDKHQSHLPSLLWQSHKWQSQAAHCVRDKQHRWRPRDHLGSHSWFLARGRKKMAPLRAGVKNKCVYSLIGSRNKHLRKKPTSAWKERGEEKRALQSSKRILTQFMQWISAWMNFSLDGKKTRLGQETWVDHQLYQQLYNLR